jgi:hypothetical protein
MTHENQLCHFSHRFGHIAPQKILIHLIDQRIPFRRKINVKQGTNDTVGLVVIGRCASILIILSHQILDGLGYQCIGSICITTILRFQYLLETFWHHVLYGSENDFVLIIVVVICKIFAQLRTLNQNQDAIKRLSEHSLENSDDFVR